MVHNITLCKKSLIAHDYHLNFTIHLKVSTQNSSGNAHQGPQFSLVNRGQHLLSKLVFTVNSFLSENCENITSCGLEMNKHIPYLEDF